MDEVPGKRPIGFGVCVGLTVGAVAALYFFDPSVGGVFPPCPFFLVTGYQCPGCGSLRALHRLLHGEVLFAFALNPLMVISIPVLGMMSFSPAWTYKRWVPWATMVILITYGVIRNLSV